MGKLILVRHGHTQLNGTGRDERLRSWLDVPLDDQGLQEAVETGERLARYPVRMIFSSDLRRARQTAGKLQRATKAPVCATQELRPWNLGVFGGQKVRELLPFLKLLSHRPELPAPGGESFHQFYGRYSGRLLELMNLAEDTAGYIVAVTHVRNLLVTKTIIEHGDETKVLVRGGPHTGALTIVEKISGVWRMRGEYEKVPAPEVHLRLVEAAR